MGSHLQELSQIGVIISKLVEQIQTRKLGLVHANGSDNQMFDASFGQFPFCWIREGSEQASSETGFHSEIQTELIFELGVNDLDDPEFGLQQFQKAVDDAVNIDSTVENQCSGVWYTSSDAPVIGKRWASRLVRYRVQWEYDLGNR